MLPFAHKIAFLIFSLATGVIGIHGFYRVARRIHAGRADADRRTNRFAARLWYALTTTLLQKRTFRKRPAISLLHAFVFYAFVFYLLVNVIDGMEGYFSFAISSESWPGAIYNLIADVLSALALVGVVALVARRFVLPARRDFRFNAKTLLHEEVKREYIRRDSLLVSGFILFHVGSRAIEEGAKLAIEGRDRLQPFASLISHAFTPENAEAWRIFGYWGALGSVLAFLVYFPYSKHVHLFMAPVKYLVSREVSSGVLPAVEVNLDTAGEDNQKLGAGKLEELAWPRLLDAYACIQCNRCQDVCPATATGKSLSPAALEINKRMELNRIARTMPEFEHGAASPRPLLAFALTPEAAWACTTCGACMQVCPVQDEQMLDIIDIRRNLVMMEGSFPAQLQTAFRGMERAKNPWGINHEQRMAWAEGLRVPTIEENPDPDVLYWVGCAASYDPQAQKTARAFVQLLARAGVNLAVLGKKECCTGDTARRAGDEYLYRQLAEQNVTTLNAVKPKLIVATCPHCMNSIGKEYRQLGGNYQVMHHTEYLNRLVAEGKLEAEASDASVTYHDPCYLGRHNGVFDAPRNVLHILSNDFVELDRKRENSFCCGAGGAQFWKEEETGQERISENRYREVQDKLEAKNGEKVLAVGCPFCKSMLSSTRGKDEKTEIAIKDVAELLLEGVLRKAGESAPVMAEPARPQAIPIAAATATANGNGTRVSSAPIAENASGPAPSSAPGSTPTVERKKWAPKGKLEAAAPEPHANDAWLGTSSEARSSSEVMEKAGPTAGTTESAATNGQPAERKKWVPKK